MAFSNNRRVVVTGIGLVTPVGNNAQDTWHNLCAGKSGISKITHFDASNLTSQVAGEVKNFDSTGVIPPKEVKKCGRFIQLGWVATHEALKNAGLLTNNGKLEDALQNRAGAVLGSGIGGFPEIESTYKIMQQRGARRISPFFIPAILTNLLAGQVSIAYGLKGPNTCAVTACATGTHSIGSAMRAIQYGEADIMVAGGAEASVSELSVAGFAAAKALSASYNSTPATASRPFDATRDGFVIGEGAGVLVLEEYEHAKARGAKILAELAGFGQTADANHITMPAPNGEGGHRAMEIALADAGLKPADINYINAHATSTPAGDKIEATAIAELFGEGVVVSATKSITGHALGAAGGMEAVFCVLALQSQMAPPTINLNEPDPALPNLDIIKNTARKMELNAVLSNSFGFGGTNGCLVFKK